MKLLLDTQAFLWFFTGDSRLTAAAREAIESAADDNLVSVASLWEIAIKASLGKLRLHAGFEEVVAQALQQQCASLLPLDVPHLTTLCALPFHHRDPFDRLLVAQAIVENAWLVSADAAFDAYGVKRVW